MNPEDPPIPVVTQARLDELKRWNADDQLRFKVWASSEFETWCSATGRNYNAYGKLSTTDDSFRVGVNLFIRALQRAMVEDLTVDEATAITVPTREELRAEYGPLAGLSRQRLGWLIAAVEEGRPYNSAAVNAWRLDNHPGKMDASIRDELLEALRGASDSLGLIGGVKPKPTPEPEPEPTVLPATKFVKPPASDLIKAPPPATLHSVRFPIYDRKDGGYRIIERAVGFRELLTMVKVFMDQLASISPSMDAREFDIAKDFSPTTFPWSERIEMQFMCSRGQVHAFPTSVTVADPLRQGDPNDSERTSHVEAFLGEVDSCIVSSYNRYDSGTAIYNEDGEFATNSVAGLSIYDRNIVNRWEQAILLSHMPFVEYSLVSGRWISALPTQLRTVHDVHDMSVFDWTPIGKSINVERRLNRMHTANNGRRGPRWWIK